MSIEDDLKSVEDPAVREIMLRVHEATLNDVPKLPEPLFRSHILPILTDTTGKANLSNWILVAGSLNRAIDVINQNGEVLFRAPPLQGSITTKTERDERPPLGKILKDWELHRGRSPIAARKFINDALSDAVPEKQRVNLEPLRMLNKIFRYYNLALIPIPGEAAEDTKLATETPTDTQSNVDFTGDFDDI